MPKNATSEIIKIRYGLQRSPRGELVSGHIFLLTRRLIIRYRRPCQYRRTYMKYTIKVPTKLCQSSLDDSLIMPKNVTSEIFKIKYGFQRSPRGELVRGHIFLLTRRLIFRYRRPCQYRQAYMKYDQGSFLCCLVLTKLNKNYTIYHEPSFSFSARS
jgi:hypothetical protein